ncbi:translation initiation factor [Olivibacter ginsenosidimutans]|uniref:Translation initiation factor n=1 Tax=Olivibacter ginsenosidimutans TaxID=1176537 RepID=A0ABP9AQV0_9SPHI
MAKTKKKQYDGVVYSTDEHFQYTETSEEKLDTLMPSQQQLRVLLDKKQRAGKAVTKVTGFIGRTDDLAALGKLLKQRCGVGGAVKDREVLIQGDFRQKVLEILQQRGYSVKLSGG